MAILDDLKSSILYSQQLGVKLTSILLVIIVSLLAVLHFQQQSAITMMISELQLIREARTDLARGMMHITMDQGEDLPFDKEIGRTLMGQAIKTLRSEIDKGFLPGDSAFINAMKANLDKVQTSLSTIVLGTTTASQAVNIHTYYQAVDNHAAQAESFAKNRLNKLSDYLTYQFVIALGLSAVLLASLYVFFYFTNKAKLKAAEEIWHQNNYDELTDLPNRRLFHDRLSSEMKKGEIFNKHLGVLLIDLDRFKEINDTLGHKLGDQLIQRFAEGINNYLPENAVLARIGGDEFGIIMEVEKIAELESLSTRLVQQFNQPYKLGPELIYCTISIGISIYPEDAKTPEDILKNVEQAMYTAKDEGRNRIRYFAPSMQESAKRRLKLAADLRLAIQSEQLELYYQPIIQMGSGLPVKVEALVRWNHLELGFVSPAEFIPIAENIGVIHQLGDWVFHQAVNNIVRWQQRFGTDLQISINKSPIQFHSDFNTHEKYFKLIKELNLAPGSLVIEITEGLLLDADAKVGVKLDQFRSAGIQIAIDDFGTGYSALSYIKKFNIDYLKIDQSFVRNLEPYSSDKALCEAIVSMAHKLGLKVIAEGVETNQQHQLLKEMDCDFGQGYLYSRPLPIKEFEAFLEDRRG